MAIRARARWSTTVAMRIAGEDLKRGDFVARLWEVVSIPSYMWDGSRQSLAPNELVRIRTIPESSGEPLRVEAVCLPFVYAKKSDGTTAVLDLRREEIARLDDESAKTVWNGKRTKGKRKQ